MTFPVPDERTQVDALIKVVEDYVRDHRRPGGGYDLPEGLCLEMHPRVRHMIMRNWMPGYSAFISGQETPFPAEIPVKVNPDLPDNAWRLAVITIDVINGGVMPGGCPVIPRCALRVFRVCPCWHS